MAKIKGTKFDDTIVPPTSTDNADTIDGGDGNDYIDGAGGSDTIKGGKGDDTIIGGSGDDRIDGGDGNDSLDGGANNDRIKGGKGNDTVIGGMGDDTIDGGDGKDNIDGGDDNDTIKGGKGDDIIKGGSGEDMLDGSDGKDNLDSGAGNDTIKGGKGDDTLAGGTGADKLIGGKGGDNLWGGTEGNVGGDSADDLFIYNSVSDSPFDNGDSDSWDKIFDFEQGATIDIGDKIDLRKLTDPTTETDDLIWNGNNGPLQHGVWYEVNGDGSYTVFVDRGHKDEDDDEHEDRGSLSSSRDDDDDNDDGDSNEGCDHSPKPDLAIIVHTVTGNAPLPTDFLGVVGDNNDVAALTITKTASVPGGTADVAGEVIDYTVTVDNAGNQTLTGVTVTDSLVNLTLASGDTDLDGMLDVTETWTYTGSHTVTQADLTSNGTVEDDIAGFIDNTATADTDQTDPASASAAVPVVNAALTITKTASVPGGTADVAGEVIDYTVTVDNAGNQTLTGVTVTDSLVNLTLASGDTDLDGMLDVTETWTYTGSHTVTQADLTSNGTVEDDIAGFIDNTATADTDQTDPASASAAVPVVNAALTITKTASVPGGTADVAGEVIDYTVTVDNAGNQTLTGVTVTDSLVNLTLASGDTDLDGMLDVTETWTYTGSHTVTQADLTSNGTVEDDIAGFIDNTATADTDQTDPASASAAVPVVNAALTITKTASVPGGTADVAGEVIDYTVTVDNAGNQTLTGVTVTDSLVNLTLASGDTDLDGMLDVTETWTYTGSHTVTQADLTSNGTVEDDIAGFIDNTATADTDQTDPASASAAVPVVNAALTITKTASVPGGTADVAGEVIDYTVTVDNAGNQTLTGVTVTDSLVNLTLASGDTDLDGMLDVTETWTYTGSHTVTQADLTSNGTVEDDIAGFIDNTATADTDQTDPASASAAVPVVNAALTITKTASVPGGTADVAGEVIDYTVTVDNAGNQTLTGVTVTDSLVNLTLASGDTDLDGMLDVTETWTYTGSHTVTQADLTSNGTVEDDIAGFIDNTATADTDQTDPASASAAVPVVNAALTITKTASVPGGTADVAGEVIDYTVTVDNAGNQTLTGVTVTDSLVNLTLASGDTDLDGMLDVTETWTYTGSHTVTQADLTSNGTVEDDIAGFIDNTATADTDQTDPASASAAVPVVNAALTITKTASVPGGTADVAGEVIDYTVTVDNAGNQTLTGVTVTDSLVNLTLASGDTDLDGMLDVTETWTYTGSHTVTQADLTSNGTVEDDIAGFIDNTATADTDQTDPASASAAVPVVNAALTITKTASVPGGTADVAGEVIDYTVTVDNAGNQTLTGVTVTDSLVNLTLASGDTDLDGMLDVTETWTYTGSHTVTQADLTSNGTVEDDIAGFIDNTATADTDQTDPASASAAVPVVNAALTITKTASVPGGTADVAGEVIDYTVTVDNAGNQTLTGVTVTDSLVNLTLASGDTDLDGMLDVTETWTYTGSHTVTQADLTSNGTVEDDIAGFIDNTATADTDQTDPASASAAVPVVNAALTITKTASVPGGTADVAGEVIDYTVTVDNAGNQTLTGVTVTDSLVNLTLASGDTDLDGMLDVTETWTYTGSHTVTQADLTSNGTVEDDIAGFIDNTATADTDQTDPASASAAVPVAPAVLNVTANDLLITDSDTPGTGTFTVTVDFSEAMDQTVDPTLTFGPAVVSTLTLNAGLSGWTDSDTYVAAYNVADGNVDHDSVTVDVTGAQDASGNAQADYTPENEFAIDTLNPTVTVNIVDFSANDADPSSALTFIFSEVPTGFTNADLAIVGGTVSPVTQDLGLDPTGKTYTASFTATDGFSGTGSVTVGTDWQDAAGNAGVGNADFIAIDRVNPTVTVNIIDTLLNDADSVSNVTFIFSEVPTGFTNADLAIVGGTVSPVTQDLGLDPTGKTYTASFTATDGFSGTGSVTVGTDWQDAAGNAGVGNADFIAIDRVNPMVTSVVANDLLITDSDTPGTGTFTVTVDFSEAMDQTVDPTLTFGPAVVSTLTLNAGLSGWTDSDTYVAAYNVADGNVDHDSVTVDVTGAQDASGNAQADYTPENEFAIDTLNPMVTSVVANDLLITDSDTPGTGTFTVTVDFSEAMDQTVDPTLTFGPAVVSTLTLNAGLSGWTDSDTYVAAYNVADGNVDHDSVTVDVTGAQDASGNAQADYTPENEFAIDTLNTTVTSVVANDLLITDSDTPGTGTFTVTVDFSEAMDQTVDPTLTFGPAVVSTLTLNAGLSGWTDSDTYVAAYNVADGNVDHDSVTVDVTGAQDASGNAQVDYTPENEFAIDTLNPMVTSVVANDLLITDSDTPGTGTFTVTVDFSEAMDQTVDPTLTFGPAVVSTLTLNAGLSGWTDSDTYVAAYNVADGNVDHDSVTVDVTGAQDASGNAQVDYTPENEFAIDTLNPMVTSVVANDLLITDSDTPGTGTFTVTVDFSEAMDQTVDPTLTFGPAVVSTLTLNAGLSGWTDSDTYVAAYNVADGNVDHDSVTVDVTGAQDASGNAQADYTPENEFAIDTLNPTVTVNIIDTLLNDADSVSNVTFIFSEVPTGFTNADLAIVGGTVSPVTQDLGLDPTGKTYTASFTATDGFSGTGSVTVGTDWQDAAGNAGVGNADFIAIDRVNPMVTSVVANDLLITDSDTPGTGTFTVTVDFSEAMDQTVDPTLTFGPAVVSTLTLNAGLSGWTDSDTYVAAYNVADGNVDHDSVTVDVTGAQDASGNAQADYTPENEFAIDTLNPTVTVNIVDFSANDADPSSALTFIFSEVPTGFTNADLAIVGGTVSPVTQDLGLDPTGKTYTASFTATDGFSGTGSVTVGTDWQDAAGNAGVGNADFIAIDRVNPMVTSVVANDLLITDSDTPGTGTFTVTVDFSEAMDQTVDPTLTFGPAVVSTLTLNAGLSGWTDSDTYVAAYNVADGNVDHDSVTIDVTGAQDASGNAQADYTPENEFAIDTLNPMVTSVVANDLLITDSDTPGTGTFTVTVDFSEAMDQTVDPTLTFGPAVVSTLTLNAGLSGWTDSDTYVAAYNVADGNVDHDSVTVDVTGAQDASGNAQVDYTPENEFAIDTLNPMVMVNIAALSLSDSGPSTAVTFEFSENVTGFLLGDLTPTNGTLSAFTPIDGDSYTATFTADDGFSGTGSVTVTADSYTDMAGNLGATGFDTVAINTLGPVVLDLDGDGLEFLPMGDASNHALFDFAGDGTKETAAWVGPDDGFLVYDANGDRMVNDGSEIAFANMTAEADTDLEALRAVFDSNGDAQLTADDAEFSHFGVWQDANGNGNTEAGEFKTLEEMAIASLDLTSDGQSYSAANGEVTVHGEASFTYHDGSQGLLGDVSLAIGGPADSSADSQVGGTISNTVALSAGITPFDQILSRQANDLRIAVYGSTDEVTIQNWYGGASNQIETIQAGNGETLVSAQVNQLIDAMAGFTADNNGMTWDQGIVAKPEEVQTVLAGSWQ